MNYILLTYLARDLAKCPVVWIEELREACVVKGEYLGNGLVKGPEYLGLNCLTNVYGEQLYTVKKGFLKNDITKVFVRKKLFTNENEFCISDQKGILPNYVALAKDELIMPKDAWKKLDLSLTTKEIIHDILDAGSFVPVIGAGADVANAVVYAFEKNYVQMAMYFGFATLSLVTAGASGSTKKVGIKLTKKEGTENFLKKAEKMTASEYEKKYGKVYVEEVLENRVKIEIPKKTKQAFKEVMAKCDSDTNMLQKELDKILVDEPWYKESGRGKGGVNQFIKHFFEYNIEQPTRNPLIARYLGIPEENFKNNLIGARNFHEASEDVVKKAIKNKTYKEMENGCSYYFVRSVNQWEALEGKGVMVIKQVQTINGVTKKYFQTMMPSMWEKYLKRTGGK